MVIDGLSDLSEKNRPPLFICEYETSAGLHIVALLHGATRAGAKTSKEQKNPSSNHYIICLKMTEILR